MLTGPQKAIAAFVLTTLGGIVAVFITQIPDNPDVQLWGGIITGVVTVLTTTIGVYQIENKPAPPA